MSHAGTGGAGLHRYSPISQQQNSDAADDEDGNDLHARGRTCGRCGTVIGANQPVRRLLKGRYVHDVCPTGPQASPHAAP